MLVLGDFSGRASRGIKTPLAGRKPVLVDCDTLDDAMKQLQVGVRIPVDERNLDLQFRSLDDFHPDQLFQNLDLFTDLRDALRSQAPRPAPPRRSAEATSDIVTGSLLDQIAGGVDPLQSFIDKAVSPHLEAKESSSEKEWKSRVEAMAADALRSLLHHRNFQQVESAWRGLDLLVRTVETGPQLKIYVLDASLDELRATPTLPQEPEWSMVLANYTFQPSIEDVELLARLSLLAEHAQAPIVAAAGSPVLGCKSIAATPDPDDWDLDQPAWNELREFPESNWLALAMPRFMGRLPYGRNGSSIDSFHFEEVTADSPHSDYLWCNAAFAVGVLAAQSFSESKWKMRLGEFRTLDHMPMYATGDTLKPGGEVLLTQRAVERMIEHGLIPLIARKDGDSLLIGMFQSVNQADAALQGRWR